ncbi:MAG: hypothetical protein KAU26_11595 [Methylococcales bacterium]|nr:hypothetical protein [Methylococcales bacterium]
MNMTQCPQCAHKRHGEEYKCPKCNCFYSPLDEILAQEAAEKEKRSFSGRLKAIKAAKNPIKAFFEEYQRENKAAPYNITIFLAIIFMFVFMMVISVM